MQSIEKKILTNVAKRGGGQIIFPQDFASYGTPDAVHKAFGRLVTSEQLLRVAQGVYCYPKIEPIPGDKLLLVSLNKSYQQSKASGAYHRANYYESARKYWKLSKDKADKVDYILGI